jgi:hypothetical protein
MAPAPALVSNRAVGEFAPAFALTRGIVPPPDATDEEDIAAFTIGGRVILVDLSKRDLDGKSLALVIRWDGTIGLEYARAYDGGHKFGGDRSGMYPRSKRESEGCIILGKVIA